MTEEEIAAAAEAARVAAVAADAEAARVAAAAATTDKKTPAAAAPAGDNAELIALRADLAAARAAAAKFDGIDPEVAKANAAKVTKAEAEAREAEVAKATAEGNFERLRELQNEEHVALLTAANQRADGAEAAVAAALAQVAKTKIDNQFANSKFFSAETIFDGPMASKLYGDHAEIVNGETVVYDKPAGAGTRVMFMDTKGKPLDFDVAMRKLIDGASNKDTILKSKTAPGASSKTIDTKAPSDATGDRLSRIAAGLRQMRQG